MAEDDPHESEGEPEPEGEHEHEPEHEPEPEHEHESDGRASDAEDAPAGGKARLDEPLTESDIAEVSYSSIGTTRTTSQSQNVFMSIKSQGYELTYFETFINYLLLCGLSFIVMFIHFSAQPK